MIQNQIYIQRVHHSDSHIQKMNHIFPSPHFTCETHGTIPSSKISYFMLWLSTTQTPQIPRTQIPRTQIRQTKSLGGRGEVVGLGLEVDSGG